MIINFTGQVGAGKTALANELKNTHGDYLLSTETNFEK